MAGGNYIKLYRSLLRWQWYQDSNTVRLFLHLLLSARYEDGFSYGIEEKRGQIVTGLKKLSQETGLSVQSLRTSLNKLKSTSEITIESTNKYSVITIVKYNEYQCVDDDESTNETTINSTNEQQTINKQVTNNQQLPKKGKESKEVKEKDKDLLLGAFASEPPSSQVAIIEPPAVITFTLNTGDEHHVTQVQVDQWKEIYPGVDMLGELRKMKGWLIANPSRRKTKKGIDKFINNWLAKEQDKTKPLVTQSRSRIIEPVPEWVRKPRDVEPVETYSKPDPELIERWNKNLKRIHDEQPKEEIDYDRLQALLDSM